MTGYLVIFENRGDRAAAAAMSIVADMPGGAKQASHSVEFETSYVGGATLDTSNHSSASPYPRPPWRRAYQFTDMADLGVLYRLHQHLSSTPGASSKEMPPACGDIPRSLRDSMAKEHAQYVQTGHLALADNGREYYYTIKGAYRAVWSQLWPLKPIICSRDRGIARRALRELGLPLEYETVDYTAKYKGVEEEIETAELVEE